MTPRRLSLLLIAALGSFLAHQLGYAAADLAAGPSEAVDHGYLGVAASFLIPLGLAAIARVIVRREYLSVGSFRWSTVARLAVLQTMIFGTQEAIEAAVAGDPAAMVARPGVWIGLTLQPIVAWFLLQAAAAGGHLVDLIDNAGGGRWQRSVGPAAAPATAVATGFGTKECALPRRRGPPSGAFAGIPRR